MRIERCNITKAIYILRDEYLENEMPKGSTYWDINNGDCENFAEEIINYLMPDGKETDYLYGVVNENFQTHDEWDVTLLSKYWKNVKPLNNLTWEETNKIRFGSHMWITDGKYHYDAECPEGTENFFELPIFKRCFLLIDKFSGGNGMTKKEVKEMQNENIIFRISQLSSNQTKKALNEENMLYQELANRNVINIDKMNEIRKTFGMLN